MTLLGLAILHGPRCEYRHGIDSLEGLVAGDRVGVGGIQGQMTTETFQK